MSTASSACDLYPPTIRVSLNTRGRDIQYVIRENRRFDEWTAVEAYRPMYGSRKSFEEGWPATAGVKFGGGLVQGRSAASAVVHPSTVELVVLTCSRQPG